jgi:hypothetical protein
MENVEEIHDKKYNWILMKGIFGEDSKLETEITIENQEILDFLHPEGNFNLHQLDLHKLPESANEIVMSD